MKLIYTIIVILLISGCSDPYTDHYIIYDDPSQTALTMKEKESFDFNGFTITPIYNFDITARVLSIRKYSDTFDIAQIDFALGWQDMSKMHIINKMDIWQVHRWYKWQVDEFIIPKEDIEHNSANMHLIPANDEVAKQLESIEEYEIVKIKGRLVDVKKDNIIWKTSTTRTDTRGGACENIFVDEVEIISKKV